MALAPECTCAESTRASVPSPCGFLLFFCQAMKLSHPAGCVCAVPDSKSSWKKPALAVPPEPVLPAPLELCPLPVLALDVLAPLIPVVVPAPVLVVVPVLAAPPLPTCPPAPVVLEVVESPPHAASSSPALIPLARII